MSRAKPASSEGPRKGSSEKAIPKLEEFLERRDYAGATTLLEFNGAVGGSVNVDLWLGYCAFHSGEYKKAADIFQGTLVINIIIICVYVYFNDKKLIIFCRSFEK